MVAPNASGTYDCVPFTKRRGDVVGASDTVSIVSKEAAHLLTPCLSFRVLRMSWFVRFALGTTLDVSAPDEPIKPLVRCEWGELLNVYSLQTWRSWCRYFLSSKCYVARVFMELSSVHMCMCVCVFVSCGY